VESSTTSLTSRSDSAPATLVRRCTIRHPDQSLYHGRRNRPRMKLRRDTGYARFRSVRTIRDQTSTA
jgi:hypothetical protein